MIDKSTITKCVSEGLLLQHKQISICDLRAFNKAGVVIRKYQVYSPKFSKIYNNLDEAAEKFIELCS